MDTVNGRGERSAARGAGGGSTLCVGPEWARHWRHGAWRTGVTSGAPARTHAIHRLLLDNSITIVPNVSHSISCEPGRGTECAGRTEVRNTLDAVRSWCAPLLCRARPIVRVAPDGEVAWRHKGRACGAARTEYGHVPAVSLKGGSERTKSPRRTERASTDPDWVVCRVASTHLRAFWAVLKTVCNPL